MRSRSYATSRSGIVLQSDDLAFVPFYALIQTVVWPALKDVLAILTLGVLQWE